MKKALLITLIILITISISAQLKVMTYNVLTGFDWNQDSTRGTELIKWVNEQKPDVLALQEMNGFTDERLAIFAKKWGHDLEAMANAITEKTRLIFVANPNNPTGTWLGGDELKSFIKGLPGHVIVVVDEAYFEYAIDPRMQADGYPDTLQWLDEFPNLIVTRTFSKAYGLAALRVGYSVSHPDIADLLNRVRQPFNVNHLAIVAASAAANDSQHLDKVIDLNAVGMQQLVAGFDVLGLDYIPSVGNFISVDVGKDGASVYDALLHEGVIVRPVANYQMPQYLRVTIGLPEENDRFLQALQKVLA